MNQIEGRGEFHVEIARYVVRHSGTMEDEPVPVFVCHLILCEVGTVYLDDIILGAFNETIGALSFGRGCDDLGIFVIYPLEELAPDEFAIKFRVVITRKSSGVYAEFREIVYYIV